MSRTGKGGQQDVKSGWNSSRKNVMCVSKRSVFLSLIGVEGTARNHMTQEGTECSGQALSCLGAPFLMVGRGR